MARKALVIAGALGGLGLAALLARRSTPAPSSGPTKRPMRFDEGAKLYVEDVLVASLLSTFMEPRRVRDCVIWLAGTIEWGAYRRFALELEQLKSWPAEVVCAQLRKLGALLTPAQRDELLTKFPEWRAKLQSCAPAGA